MMKKLFFIFYFFSSIVFSQGQNTKYFHVPNFNDSVKEISLDSNWLFKDGDNILYSTTSFDDSKWLATRSELPFNADGTNKFTGICWLRLHFYLDSIISKMPLCLLIDQGGASDIFLDGKLIHSNGIVSLDASKEVKYNPNETPCSFNCNAANSHVLAIRYSNTNFKVLYKKLDAQNPGISIKIADLDNSLIENFSRKIFSISVLTAITMFFLTLGFVHLLLYLFYRKQKTNLYYSIFVVLLGCLFIFPMISENSTDPELSLKSTYYFPFVILAFFHSMLTMEYYIFEKAIKKSFWYATAIIVIIALLVSWISGINDSKFFILSFVIGTICASFSIVIKAIIRKVDGAWIIGTGSLLFLVFLSINVIAIIILNGVTYQLTVNNAFGYLILASIFLAIMSIPLSMSIYLAREFSQTNKNLEKELLHVEELSAKSIDQEKEKQKILETQKEMLEIQVIERTSEITEQKKIIEEKNKDITDSINYAKRIQEAILPEQPLLNKLFVDSFVLFKPKDIVSGDFYWFAEHNGIKIIAVADCTGHGVPGALMSMIGSNILNKLVLEKGITQPDLILNELNEEVRTALKQKESTSETRDGMDIAIISITDNQLQYAGAHRPLYIVNNTEIQELKANKFPIGGIQQEEKRVFTNHALTLQKNDALYLSSDGFADQFGGINGKKLMTKTFKELLINIQNKKMNDQKEFLNETIEKWKGSREQVDDILVIGIKF